MSTLKRNKLALFELNAVSDDAPNEAMAVAAMVFNFFLGMLAGVCHAVRLATGFATEFPALLTAGRVIPFIIRRVTHFATHRAPTRNTRHNSPGSVFFGG